MKHFILLQAAMLAGLLAIPNLASAQPTDLFACSSVIAPPCASVGGGAIMTACDRLFDIFYGRVAWYPLRCVGPITIAIETVAIPTTQFPLYVEVVPRLEPPAPCGNDPGYVVFIAYGVGHGCGGWETSSSIDITDLVPIGSLYTIRLHYFGNNFGSSPATDCIRVTATPATSALVSSGWGNVKTLYR